MAEMMKAATAPAPSIPAGAENFAVYGNEHFAPAQQKPVQDKSEHFTDANMEQFRRQSR